MMALVGVSISGMPGPPLGPSYRITITAPCARMHSIQASSQLDNLVRAMERQYIPMQDC